MRLTLHASVLMMPFCCSAVRVDTQRDNETETRIISFGQNIWGNLAVGSSSDCSVTTAAGKPEPACSPQIVSGTFHAPGVALGATWTHVVADGHLYSAGWAGDGGCGFSPNVKTNGMEGEHVTKLVDASTRWHEVLRNFDLDMYANAFKAEIEKCDGAEFNLSSASAAYTSSLLLSADGRCVFTTGLAADLPTNNFAIPKRYLREGTLQRPLPVFASEEKEVQQVLAAYGNNFLLMEDGKVLSVAGFGGGSDANVASSWAWKHAPEFTKPIVKLYGNGWTYYGALAKDGDLYMWSDYGSIEGIASDGFMSPKLVDTNVAQASLGPEHFLVLKADGSLWSAGTNGCGQTGQEAKNPAGLAQVAGSWKAACAGFYYSMAIGVDDKLYMWGSINANTYHGGDQVCTEEGKTHSRTPLPIAEFFAMQGEMNAASIPSHIDSIACGFYHGVAMAKAE